MKNKVRYFLLMSFVIVLSISLTSFIKKQPWRYGVALYSFHQHSFKTGLDMAVRSGVTNIEGFSFQKLGDEFGDRTLRELNAIEVERIKNMLKERSLKMPSLYVSAAGATEWEEYFKLGKRFNVNYFVSEPAAKDLDIVDSLAGLYKIKVAIHQHAKPGAYWHPDSVLAAINGRKNLGACADVGHWVRSGVNPVEALEKLAGNIIGIHFKDVTLQGEDVPLGSGAIDYPRLVKELKKQHYTGIMSMECEYNWEDNTEDIKRSIQYVDNIVQGNSR